MSLNPVTGNLSCNDGTVRDKLHVRGTSQFDGTVIFSGVANATGLTTSGGSVSVGASLSPTAGQVLTATGPTTAVWQSPSGIKGSAMFVQVTQAPNNSVPPGTAFSLLVDHPSGVYNTAGSGITAGAGNGGTVITLTNSGLYSIDYELSLGSAGSVVLWTGLVSGGVGAMSIYTPSVAGSSTATTWIHGRTNLVISAPTYVMLTSQTGTAGVVTAGNDASAYIVRVTVDQLQ